jgi:hypothetical protein
MKVAVSVGQCDEWLSAYLSRAIAGYMLFQNGMRVTPDSYLSVR